MVISTCKNDITVTFNGNELEVVPYYKYAGLEFDCSHSWNSCVEKWVTWNMKVLNFNHNKCRGCNYGAGN